MIHNISCSAIKNLFRAYPNDYVCFSSQSLVSFKFLSVPRGCGFSILSNWQYKHLYLSYAGKAERDNRFSLLGSLVTWSTSTSLRLSINRFKLFSNVPNFLMHLIWNKLWFKMLLLVIWICSFILLYCPVWRCAFSFHLCEILAIWEGLFTSLSASDDWHCRYR